MTSKYNAIKGSLQSVADRVLQGMRGCLTSKLLSSPFSSDDNFTFTEFPKGERKKQPTGRRNSWCPPTFRIFQYEKWAGFEEI